MKPNNETDLKTQIEIKLKEIADSEKMIEDSTVGFGDFDALKSYCYDIKFKKDEVGRLEKDLDYLQKNKKQGWFWF